MSSSRFEVEKVSGDSFTKASSSTIASHSEELTGLVQSGDTSTAQSTNAKKDEFILMKDIPSNSTIDLNSDEFPQREADLKAKEEDIKDEKHSRFHVEFVDAERNLSPPTSPTHDSHTDNLTHTQTYYHRTFGHNTQEAIPMVAYYRNTETMDKKAQRPTLVQLHEGLGVGSSASLQDDDTTDVESPPINTRPQVTVTPVKFGWIKGVLVRCILNIWGVMLFLRLSWIVGQAGIGFTLLIIFLSSVVTSVTTLSMSAICTNGQVRSGGAYYLISRSLGPEFGGAIGLIFSLANAIAVAMYVVGFAETVVELMAKYNATITGNDLNDVRVIGAITVLILLGITQLGMAWEAKMQIVLLIILLVAIANFLIGTFIPASSIKMSEGYFSYQTSIASENFAPSYRNDQSFFSLFAIFFPAATGILAGCNISGDLKDAQKAIPKGTLLAIGITTVVYAIIAVILGCTEVRFASGNPNDFIGVANTTSLNCTSAACGFGWYYTVSSANCTNSSDAILSERCYPSGLLNDYQAMQKISFFWPIIVAGIFAATLSSALASLVSAPKVFQAVCRDKIFPFIGFFGKGAPKTDEPRYGYLLTFAIALGFILIGQLNAIAPIISNFFLASYTLINYSCFSASLAKSPGWRPAFKFYNKWLSLFGAAVCCAIMFVIEWWAALVTIVIVVCLYKYVDYKKPDVNWGSSTQAYTYTQALNHTLKLTTVDDHIKNFRPQLLVLSGPPENRPALVDLSSQITRNVSLMLCANITVANQDKQQFRSLLKEKQKNQVWLKKQHHKAFYTSLVSSSLTEGVLSIMQVSGLGKMRTNTLMMGYKSDWQNVSGLELTAYINIIHNAFDMNYGVCILRMKEGLDISQYITGENEAANLSKSNSGLISKAASDINISDELSSSAVVSKGDYAGKGKKSKELPKDEKKDGLSEVNAATIKSARQFQSIQEKGKTIDVWWLFDDGGLTVLLPYLLSTKQNWSGCRMRVFTGGKNERIDQDKRSMAQLLSKFRIGFEDVVVIGDINAKPRKESIKNFEKMIEPYRLGSESNSDDTELLQKPWEISDEQLKTFKEKTNRQIRLQELLQKHSKDAALIMMTLPIARKGACSSALYMAWLEELTRNLPPIVLLRGNQTSVLTFYS